MQCLPMTYPSREQVRFPSTICFRFLPQNGHSRGIPSIQMALSKKAFEWRNSFVEDGYQRALAGFEAAIRPKVEEKYALDWQNSGLMKRWILRRRIEHEISQQVAQASKHISKGSLF